MPILKRDDAEIYYEAYGSGHTVLLFAPGGMRSRLAMWRTPDGGSPARGMTGSRFCRKPTTS